LRAPGGSVGSAADCRRALRCDDRSSAAWSAMETVLNGAGGSADPAELGVVDRRPRPPRPRPLPDCSPIPAIIIIIIYYVIYRQHTSTQTTQTQTAKIHLKHIENTKTSIQI